MSKANSLRRPRRDGESAAATARRPEVSRGTVYRHVRKEDLPPAMPTRASRPSKMGRRAPVVDQRPGDDRRERRRRRHAARRVRARLTEGPGAEVPEATARGYVRRRRARTRSGRDQPLGPDRAPGAAQADLGAKGTKASMGCPCV